MKESITKILICISLCLIGACTKSPISVEKTNNGDFKVEFLFEKDGCKMYRFYDVWQYHYFMTTSGHTETNHKEGDAESYLDAMLTNHLMKDEYFELHCLSLTEITFIAFNFNAFVVRLKD